MFENFENLSIIVSITKNEKINYPSLIGQKLLLHLNVKVFEVLKNRSEKTN